jgi:hydrogenase/urease accessory protein HupE
MKPQALAALGVVLAALIVPVTLHAHPLGFGTASLKLETDARCTLELVVDAPEAEVAEPDEPGATDKRQSNVEQRVARGTALSFDGKSARLQARVIALGEGPSAIDIVELTGRCPSSAQSVQLQVSSEIGDVVWEVRLPTGSSVHRALLIAGETSPPVPLQVPQVATSAIASGAGSGVARALGGQGSRSELTADPSPSVGTQQSQATPQRPATLAALWTYLRVGYEHILPLGVDHVLFVVGVCITALSLKRAALELTLFTLAHSVTLALSALGLVQVNIDWVEPLIALSIAALGAEVFWPAAVRWRVPTIFAFGLLHGLGFASALNATGLLTQGVVVPLLGFNLGVELGQLTVALLVWLATFKLRQHERYAAWVQKPVAWSLVACGGLWCLQRVLA